MSSPDQCAPAGYSAWLKQCTNMITSLLALQATTQKKLIKATSFVCSLAPAKQYITWGSQSLASRSCQSTAQIANTKRDAETSQFGSVLYVMLRTSPIKHACGTVVHSTEPNQSNSNPPRPGVPRSPTCYLRSQQGPISCHCHCILPCIECMKLRSFSC